MEIRVVFEVRRDSRLTERQLVRRASAEIADIITGSDILHEQLHLVALFLEK